MNFVITSYGLRLRRTNAPGMLAGDHRARDVLICNLMAHWYYGDNGQQNGPLDDDGIRQAISDGKLTPYTLVWREGMAGWMPLLQVPELSGGSVAPGYSGQVPPHYAVPYGAMPGATPGLAIASMVCGIVGIFFCYLAGLLGIPAVICGHMALNRISQSPIPLGGRGMAIAGLILGYLAILISLGSVIAFVVAISSSSGFKP
jgi:hypothetical protein